jgi:hypothetical protein
MAQTKEGAKKARLKLIEKFGSEEAYKENQRKIASIGGKNGVGGGFGHGMNDPRVIGRLGGLAPRKKAKMPTPYDN